MPVQKGKRRKRPRRRGPSTSADVGAVAVEKAAGSRRVGTGAPRRRWQPPLWLNFGFGVGMLILGVVFTITPQKGFGLQEKLVLLGLYCLVSLFYLSRAYRQIRERRGSN